MADHYFFKIRYGRGVYIHPVVILLKMEHAFLFRFFVKHIVLFYSQPMTLIINNARVGVKGLSCTVYVDKLCLSFIDTWVQYIGDQCGYNSEILDSQSTLWFP